MSRAKSLKFFILKCCLVLSPWVFAQEESKEKTLFEETIEASKRIGQKSESIIEETHGKLSNSVLKLSDSIDDLLGSQVKDAGEQTTNLKIQFGLSQLESESALFNTKIKSKLVLPRTQKRFQLVMHNLRDEIKDEFVTSTEENARTGEATPEGTVQESSFLMALRYKLKESKIFSLTTDAGVRLTLPLDSFAKLKSRQYFALGPINTSVLESIHWFDSSGFGFDTGIEFSHRLSRDFSIRQSNLMSWEEEVAYREIRNELALTQIIGDRRSISYFISARGDDEQVILMQSYTMGVSFSTWVGWPWLSLTAVPFYIWSRENAFFGIPGFATQIDAVVGHF